MTREMRHSPVGQRRVAALFTSGAVTRLSAAFARILKHLTPNPGRDLNRLGQKQRRDLYKTTHDEMRANLGLPPIKWSRK